jgi:ZIP family zinc transporter/zinc and cadmium transporter
MALTPLWLALAAGLGNVVGAAAVVRGARGSLRAIETSLAFGAGFMLAVVLVGALPTVFRNGDGTAAFFVLGGYLVVHLAQHVIVPHFHFGEETHQVTSAAAMSAVLGLSLHSFFDGVAIASGFLHTNGLGVMLFLAVLLHKLPEGVAVASVSLAGGHRPGQAIRAAAVLGSATVLGLLLTEAAASLHRHGLALASGVTLYVAASNLVPEFQAKPGWVLPAAFFGGALALVLMILGLGGVG